MKTILTLALCALSSAALAQSNATVVASTATASAPVGKKPARKAGKAVDKQHGRKPVAAGTAQTPATAPSK